MKLKREHLTEYQQWYEAGVNLPSFSVQEMMAETKARPTVIHFGGDDRFRAGLASLHQRLLNSHAVKTGIILVDQSELLEKIYQANDNLSLGVTLHRDGASTREIIASVADCIPEEDFSGLTAVFQADSLQVASFTWEEGAMALQDQAGHYLPQVEEDFKTGLSQPTHKIALVTALLHARFLSGELPLSLMSMARCAKNGKLLQAAVLDMATHWQENQLVTEAFLDYLNHRKKISFPATVVDKMAPAPLEFVAEDLDSANMEGMLPISLGGEKMAAFFNSERYQYFFFEKKFVNGCPPWENAGVIMLKRRDLRQVETVVQSCGLAMMETVLFLFSELFEIESLREAVQTRDILTLLQEILYEEALPVLEEIKEFPVEAYMDELLQQRLDSPLLDISPKIFGDEISQKMPKQLGVILKKYKSSGRDTADLVAIPLVIATWFRYMMGVSDQGLIHYCAVDSLSESVKTALKPVVFAKKDSYDKQLRAFLRNRAIFAVNLESVGLAEDVHENFVTMIGGKGAVERCLAQKMSAFVVE